MLKTAEFVSPLHPDKICDGISDAILDGCLKEDEDSRCAVEVMGGHGAISISGEITAGTNPLESPEIYKNIPKSYQVHQTLVKQSPEIANGVDDGGAGDQGIVVGYACRDNDEMMPEEYRLARQLCKYLHEIHPDDGKTQITLNESNEVEVIVASWRGVNKIQLLDEVREWAEYSGVIMAKYFDVHCNPAGDWEVGGFEADTGVTGRKIVVDAYGPRVQVGGGAFSGKDATKVDRSGAYKARQLAVTLLKRNEDVNEVQVQVAYAIGKASPVQIAVKFDKHEWADLTDEFAEDFAVRDIIADLDLKKPQFAELSKWGHFGNGNLWDKPVSI